MSPYGYTELYIRIMLIRNSKTKRGPKNHLWKSGMSVAGLWASLGFLADGVLNGFSGRAPSYLWMILLASVPDPTEEVPDTK